MKCKKQIPLHPDSNSGESAVAEIGFKDRQLYLDISAQSYGNATSTMWLNMSPDVMIRFGEALMNCGKDARRFFEKSP